MRKLIGSALRICGIITWRRDSPYGITKCGAVAARMATNIADSSLFFVVPLSAKSVII